MKIVTVPKNKMKVGKGKSGQAIGGNPEAAKSQKWDAKAYKQAKVSPKNTIIVSGGLKPKQRAETIKHEQEEYTAMKYKGESYKKAHRKADFFISFCREYGDYLTNLKLQKLLYFAQGWYLAFFNEPLFDDEIQAWIHGPVVPSVYQRFRGYSYNPITESIESPSIDEKVKNHLIDIFEYYSKYTAFDLERISHDSQPWINARKGLLPDQASTNVITIKDMREYYTSLNMKG